DAHEYVISDEFMTNADVPMLATKNIFKNPTNPFTGNVFNDEKNKVGEQWITASGEWSVSVNNGKTFLPSTWFAVKDNIWNPDNWRYIDEVTTMPSELLEKQE
ncbi:MAG: hypothetical protein J6A10_07745, partial [Peptococcaceae bacterium]|nr:hypothetical protein [Peptococcaceae bacterium]